MTANDATWSRLASTRDLDVEPVDPDHIPAALDHRHPEREVPVMSTHTAVVRIPDSTSHESIARAAAHASLSLLTKVSAEQRGSVTIKSVTITQPEGIDIGPDFMSLLSGPGKAVVVVAEAQDPSADAEPSA